MRPARALIEGAVDASGLGSFRLDPMKLRISKTKAPKTARAAIRRSDWRRSSPRTGRSGPIRRRSATCLRSVVPLKMVGNFAGELGVGRGCLRCRYSAANRSGRCRFHARCTLMKFVGIDLCLLSGEEFLSRVCRHRRAVHLGQSGERR